MVGNIAVLVLVGLFAAYLFWGSLKKSVEPGRLIARWLVTFVLLGGMASSIPLAFSGSFGTVAGVLNLAALGVILGLVWAPSWAGMLVAPLTSAFDGGNVELEKQGFYARAEAKRRRNQFHEAIAEIRTQLRQVPDDFHGQMLLADIYAEDLKDLTAAQLTIERLLGQPGRTPPQIAGAWSALADWHLKLAQDPDAAREALRQIIVRLPETPFSQMASERIAHLASREQLLEKAEPSRIVLPRFEKDLGLKPEEKAASAPQSEEDAATVVARYVRHLEQHPLDSDAREKLAVAYAERYGRMELAEDQLEQLIGQPEQPPRRVIHWLNLLSDLYLKHGDMARAESCLHRIMEQFPGTGAADQALQRLYFMRAPKSEAQSKPIQLVESPRNLGLKIPPPNLKTL